MNHDDFTPVRELPEALPPGEHVLWQGAPVWKSLFRHAFHGRTLAIYFGVLLALRAATVLSNGGTIGSAAVAVLWLAPLAAIALGLIALIAWLSARATYYTITNRRVVMRIGIVLEVTFNFPFTVIGSAGLRLRRDGSGDIPLAFTGGDRIAYLHLWPHARPWKFRHTEPMMRSVPDAERVADLLARALASSTGGTAHAVVSPFETSGGSVGGPASVAAANR